jgi:hypothetical protein
MLSDIVPIRQYIWTLFLELLFDDDGEDDNIQNANDDDDVNLKEESNSILKLAYDVCDMVVGVNMSNISTTHNSGKRKKKQNILRCEMKKKTEDHLKL